MSALHFLRYVAKFISKKKWAETKASDKDAFTNVYVKNFGESLDDDKLRSLFQLYGSITSAKVKPHQGLFAQNS